VFTFSLTDMAIMCSFVEIKEKQEVGNYNETNPPPETKPY
jgi:hypothetical protein